MPLTTFLATRLNAQVFGGRSFKFPGTLWAALSTTTPAPDGSGFTEPSGEGYRRVPISTEHFVAVRRAQGNDVPIEFPRASEPWGTPTWMGFYDQAKGGNLLAYGDFDPPKPIDAGDALTIPPRSFLVAIG